jgi:TRAP-type C4-dicarboxylate transport system permease small subunit
MERLKRFLTSFLKRFDSFNDILALVSGGLIGFTTLIVIYEVIMRYLVRKPTTWVNDISEILLVYLTFLGSAWVLRLGGHIKIDIIETLFLKERGKVILLIFQNILSLFFCFVFTWITWDSFWDSLVTQERTGGGLFSVPLWPVYMVIPFGAALLCIQLIRQIVDNFVYFSKSHREES